MGKFIGDLTTTNIGPGYWRLAAPISYVTDFGVQIDVPVGFETDFASVPRPFWVVFPRDDKWTKAAVIHDWLYNRRGKYDPDKPALKREDCDKTFLEAMDTLGVDLIHRRSMYRAVRMFGWWPWMQPSGSHSK